MLESQTESGVGVWTVSQCDYTVEYSLRVIEDIRTSVMDAFFSLPRGGAEIGGILLGTHEGRQVTITDFVPLDCEHATGPSFVLSPNDHLRLADLLSSARGSRLGARPVGWYHSHTRSEIHLSAADIEIHRRYFPEPWQVALVLKPHTFHPMRAGFFFQEANGSIHATACYREFVPETFAPALPGPSATAVSPSLREPESGPYAMEMPVKPQREVPVQAPPVARKVRNKKRLAFLAIGWTCSIALMFALGMLVNNGSFRERSANALHALDSSRPAPVSQPSESPSPSSLALHAKRQNGDVELNWSRDPAVMATASSGLISIQDGESKRNIALDATQVRSGSLLYSPLSDQIVMQLSVTTPAGVTTESVMVILPKAGVPRTYPLPVSNAASVGAVQSVPPRDMVALQKASKPFQEPVSHTSAAPAVPAAPIPADSPALKLDLDPRATVAPSILTQMPAAPPPSPATFSQRTGSQTGSIVIRYQPAIAISKPAPAFPPELQPLGLTRKVVEVKVTIDRSGRVTRAEAIPQRNISQFLVAAALNAARLWKFQPARRDDAPVESETLLQFAFDH